MIGKQSFGLHAAIGLMAAAMAFSTTAHGQSRGGMPREIPFPRELPDRGIPERVPDVAQRAQAGLDRTEAAQRGRLSKTQMDKAAAIAKATPADYELDRNGALAVRGEILATGLSEATLGRLRRAGFSVSRRDEVAGLGIALVVLTHADMSASRGLKRLFQLDPEGSYELNHVYFESGRAASSRAMSQDERASGAASEATVGLIDTGVAKAAEAAPRVRIVRRNFAGRPGEGKAHGTAVAALLARKPGQLTIYSADVFGEGPRGGTTELLVKALGWMTQERVPVVNVSMVGPSNRLVAAVIAQMVGRGFTIVAPVGNDGPAARMLFPASYPGVIAVSGATADGRLLPEASRVRRVDFVAPGIATVPDPAGRPTVVRGTSFAAPIVSRHLAGLVRAPDPIAAKRAVDQLARLVSRPVSGRGWFGRGMIDVPVSTEKSR